jgi:hypothetical protein
MSRQQSAAENGTRRRRADSCGISLRKADEHDGLRQQLGVVAAKGRRMND